MADLGPSFESAAGTRPSSPSPIGAAEAQQVVRNQRAARLQSDAAALVQLDRQLSSLESNIVDLEKQVLLLNEVIQLSRAEREDLLLRRDMFRTNVEASRRSLCPASMCTEDVLRLVFKHLVSSFSLGDAGCNHFHDTPEPVWEYEHRIRASNAVASVCTAWRAAALLCPPIWSTIVLRSNGTDTLNCHARDLPRLLSRSGATPLDIFVYAREYDEDLQVDIMNQLYVHIHRWRRFDFSMSDGCTIPIHKYLRGTAPLLERLSITRGQGDVPSPAAWTATQSQYYLDRNPRLRDVDLTFVPFALDGRSASLSLLANLQLTLHDTIPSAMFWNMFDLPALECLDLNIPGSGLLVDRPGDAVELPALRHLTLRAHASEIPARFRRAFRSRRLEYCHFDHTWPSGREVHFVDLAGFLDLCSASLRSVVFSRPSLSADEGAMIAASLDKATSITFNSSTLDPRCIAAFRAGFSALEEITMWDTNLLDDAIEMLIDFVRHKNAYRPTNGEEVQAPERLTFVQLTSWRSNRGFSERDKLEINRLVDG